MRQPDGLAAIFNHDSDANPPPGCTILSTINASVAWCIASLSAGGQMFDHVKFGVTDYAASKAFYLKALEPLGLSIAGEGAPAYGVELCTKSPCSLCLFQTDEKPAHLHLAFTADNRQQVDAFYYAALEAGGRDHGAPGLRPRYHANYYAAFVIDPDGHNIEVVCQHPVA